MHLLSPSVPQMDFITFASERLTNLRERVAYTGRILLERSRKWRSFSAKPPTNCDVVVSFERGTHEEQVDWISNRIQARIPELIFTKTFHNGTQRMALYLTCSFMEYVFCDVVAFLSHTSIGIINKCILPGFE